MKLFREFIDRKQREAKRHLKIIEQVLQKSGLQAKGYFSSDEEPYVFVKAPSKKLSFEGVRIYEIGEMVAYRVVKEEKTEPYGKAYRLNLEEMFNDYMSENKMKEEEAAQKVIESVVLELKKFFAKSEEAEQQLKDVNGSESNVILKTGGTDYSSLVFSKY
jgi:hypothetical protein